MSSEEIPEVLGGLDATDWIIFGVVLLVGLLVSRVAKRLVIRAAQRAGAERSSAVLLGKVTGYVLVAAALVYALSSIGVAITPLIGALGIGGLAIAIAMQHSIENVISGIYLETRRPFRRGDEMSTGDHSGFVQDINLRATVLRTYDGRIVHVPNSDVLNSPIVNNTAEAFRRSSLVVGVEYGADLSSVRDTILEAVRGAGVESEPAPAAWVTSFSESSIDFEILFWHPSDKASEWRVTSDVAMAVKAAFADKGINIPFPQRRLGPVDLTIRPESWPPPST